MTALRLFAIVSLCGALSACAAIRNVDLWPFGDDDSPQARAAAGERVSVIGFDQTITAAEGLRGVAFELPPAAPIAAWPLPGGTPEQSVEHVEAAPALEIAWRRPLGQGPERGRLVTAPPVSGGGRIYAMDAGSQVSAFDAASGAQAWRVDLNPRQKRDRAFGGGVAFADGRLFVASGFRFVAALDAATGAEIWRTATEAPVHGAPTVAAGRVFVVSTDNEVLSFDTVTGAAGWTHQALIEPARFAIASTPAVSGDVVVAPFSSGELAALRVQNGNELWNEVLSRSSRNNALSEIRDIAGRPVIYRGDVFAASHSGVFGAIDLRTGQRRWSLPITGLTTPWPAGDVVYVISKAGELACVSRDSGQVYWVTDLGEGRTENRGGFLGFFDREVRPIWSGPVLASNRLILVNSQGDLVSVDPRTGAVQRTVRLGAPAFLSPIATNGMLYVVTQEAQLVAIR
jgi:outer membrane protein assembly factor BamB